MIIAHVSDLKSYYLPEDEEDDDDDDSRKAK